MSRSVKKHPVHGITTARSEAFDKKVWHRALRRKTRAILSSCALEDTPDLPSIHEMSDPWIMLKDGKSWWNPRPDWTEEEKAGMKKYFRK